MLALCSVLLQTYFAQNCAGIIPHLKSVNIPKYLILALFYTDTCRIHHIHQGSHNLALGTIPLHQWGDIYTQYVCLHMYMVAYTMQLIC